MLSHYMYDSCDPWMDDPLLTGRHSNFGRSFHPHDLRTTRPLGMSVWHPSGYRRNWHLADPRSCSRDDSMHQSKQLSCVMGEHGFQVCVDVHQFAPKEISVRTANNSVVIEGKHEERPDENGYIQRHFVRRYTLPETTDVEHITTTLSSDGVLTVKAPPKREAVKGAEREVPIQHTGPVHLSVKTTADQATTANGNGTAS